MIQCYAVFYQGKQIKVFHYMQGYCTKDKAIEFCRKAREQGYGYQLEEFNHSGVGVVIKF